MCFNEAVQKVDLSAIASCSAVVTMEFLQELISTQFQRFLGDWQVLCQPRVASQCITVARQPLDVANHAIQLPLRIDGDVNPRYVVGAGRVPVTSWELKSEDGSGVEKKHNSAR